MLKKIFRFSLLRVNVPILAFLILSKVAFCVTYTLHPAVQVEFAGIKLIELHYGIGSFSSQNRADAILVRVQKLANNRLFDTSTISVKEIDVATEIYAGEDVLISITEHDAQALNVSRSDLAASTAHSIRRAIERDRESKSPRELLVSSAYAGIATIALVLLLFLFARFFPKAATAIQASRGSRIKSLRIRSLEVLTADRIVAILLWLVHAVRVSLTVILLYIYIPLVLSFFPWTANFAPKLLGFILNPVKKIGHIFYDFLPNLFFIIVALIITKYVLRFVQIFFLEIEKGTLNFQGFYQEWAEPTYKLVRFLILAFALIIIFPYLPGSGSPAFQGVSVFLGILFSLGSSSAIANVVAGVVLTYMRPFRLGDRVKIADTMGDVVEKTLLITRIRTIKNADITIPNSMVLGSHIINYSSTAKLTGLILHTTVTIGYDVPWKTVHSLLLRAALKTTGVKEKPAPFVLQTSLDDFYVSYEINAYTDEPNKMALMYSMLHQNIQDAFNEAQVEIMSPHYTSLRDGNDLTIPAQERKSSRPATAFRFEAINPKSVEP